MPFDTTYHISPGNKYDVITIAVPGGKDTDIYLQPGELPPGFTDSSVSLMIAPTEKMEQTISESHQKQPEHYIPGNAMVFTFLALLFYACIRITREAKLGGHYNFDDDPHTDTPSTRKPPCLSFDGSELDNTDATVVPVLTKHFPYFNLLDQAGKQKFLQRLKKFIGSKIFKIHDRKGFKEMPILISAAAIQLSFGLEKYLMPNFEFIHIYPEEFLGIHPSIRFLEGNVSGQSIRISWKHFLEGFEYPADGQNVGLHEMAHAYYYQNFETGEYIDHGFVNGFSKFNSSGDKAFQIELAAGNDLYSDYAVKNFQEFWAESIEIFFEKPIQLKNTYTELYSALCDLLNQDPVNNIFKLRS